MFPQSQTLSNPSACIISHSVLSGEKEAIDLITLDGYFIQDSIPIKFFVYHGDGSVIRILLIPNASYNLPEDHRLFA